MDKLTANELRIGNLLEYNGEIREVAVINLTEVGFKVPLTINAISIHRFAWNSVKPIPLTEEWLVRMGFEKYSDGGDLHGIDCFYCKGKLKGAISLPEFMFNGFIQIKHVHQLQNLYFALTGEELTIKSN